MSDEKLTFEVFPWNSNLETGIPVIDEQHARLVALINELAAALTRSDDREIAKVFDELASYASYHFKTEEFVWRDVLDNDEMVEEHELQHAGFLPHVLEMKEQDEGKPLREVVEDVMAFLIRWLAYHIIDSDKKLALIYHHIKEGDTIEEAKRAAATEMVDSARVITDTVLSMYDSLASLTLEVMREREQREKIEAQLRAVNTQLAEMATTDQLTGLHNRRHLELVFDQEMHRAMRYDDTLTFMMLDVDFFKKLNDNYGHAEGDVALEQLGTLFNEICRRPGDYAFRLGGEEFAILIYGLSEEDAVQFAEKVRQAVYTKNIKHEFSSAADRLTISIGVAVFKPEQSTRLDDYMAMADRRLYAAKEGGRNRVCAED